MNDPRHDTLRQAAWRGRLTPGQQDELRAWLEAHPEARPDWEQETALTDALQRLPDAPVPSNFTARVLQAVQRECRDAGAAPARRWNWKWFARSLLPRAAVAIFALGFAVYSYQLRQDSERMQLAQRLAMFSSAAQLPPRYAADFEAIRQLGQVAAPDAAVPDEVLLALDLAEPTDSEAQ